MHSNEYQVEQLAKSPVLPGGLPYGVEIFGGDVDTNPFCKQVVGLLQSHLPVQTVLEIGSGGGRWSRYLDKQTQNLICVDGSKAMIPHIEALNLKSAVRYLVCPDGELPQLSADLVFTYDTFVHFPPALFWTYLHSIVRLAPKTVVLHHGTRVNKQPHQPDPLVPGWNYYDDEEVDAFFSRGNFNRVDQAHADGGYGSRVAIYVAR